MVIRVNLPEESSSCLKRVRPLRCCYLVEEDDPSPSLILDGRVVKNAMVCMPSSFGSFVFHIWALLE